MTNKSTRGSKTSAKSDPREFGKFSGDPETSWLPDGRLMKLLSEFTFTDATKNCWIAPIDAEIDGASIPKVFWSVIGGPYEGKYRNASVVHDVACGPPHKKRWQDVHRMFYAACRAGDLEEKLAKIMFAAVYHFGPRWDMPSGKAAARTLRSSDDLLRASVVIDEDPGISLRSIEAFTHPRLAAVVSDLQVSRERDYYLATREMVDLEEELAKGEFVPGRPVNLGKSRRAAQGRTADRLGQRNR